ncbi:MAG: transport system ATP-binding/permease protein [Solirubrobacteraceae bacterium]|nr:transport system ATP-binding/permease protein [Solirubrobacteraceae bacterium]
MPPGDDRRPVTPPGVTPSSEPAGGPDPRSPAYAAGVPRGGGWSATVLYEGRRIDVAGEGLTIGRLADNEVVIAKHSVSRRHARISPVQGGYWITDLGSRNGTQLNGERFHGESRWLANGDTVLVGGQALRFVSGEATRHGAERPSFLKTHFIEFPRDRLTIGRDRSNDVVLEDPNVSRFHAEIVRDGERVALYDLGSRNGTRIDAEPIRHAILTAGSEIGIGPYRLLFDGRSFHAREERGALRLDAERVAMNVKEKQILAPTSLSVEPGEFVAVIGESGSGKSTLVKALAGVTAPSEGSVTVSGEPIASRLTDVGYLPQDEIVHGKLSVTEALTYAAKLRLPHDTTKAEIAASVERVLGELGLEEHAHTRVESLSGGQRKRVGLAVELLGQPSLLFLDEPTTGLDPGLETRMMTLLGELAEHGRAVVVVTHATKNLDLCRKLVVMGRGGELCFQGTPDAALEFFGGDGYDDIYAALERVPAIEWRRRFDEQERPKLPPDPEEEAPAGKRRRGRRRRRGRVIPQARVLTSRYVRLFLRDRRNILILVGQVPVLALAIVGLFNADVFGGSGEVSDAVKLLFLIVTVAMWVGTIDSAREIIKEKGVYVREEAVGVRMAAYLFSKVAVLFVLAAVQSLLLAGIVFAFQPLHGSRATYVTVALVLVLTAFAAVAIGLLMSAAVRTQDQATSFIPMLLIPQLFFGGSIVPVATMSEPLAQASKVVVAQWSYAGMGSALDLNARIAADKAYAQVSRIGTEFFDVAAVPVYLILGGFVLAALGGVALLLRRQAGR